MRSVRSPLPKQLVAILLGLGLVLGLARSASAYCRVTTCDPKKGHDCNVNDDGCVRDGAALRWPSMPIVYRFHAGGSEKLDREEARIAVRAAFQRWSDVLCDGERRTSLRFEEREDTRYDKPLVANAHAKEGFGIFFRDSEWPYEGGENTLAITNHDYGVKTGFINYADIEINTSSDQPFSTSDADKGIDPQSVFTHEGGQYIGLAHNKDPESIMVATHCQQQERCADKKLGRRLSDDDKLAVCTLYPPDGTSLVPSAQQASCATSTTGRDGSGALIGIAIALGLVFVRRRRAQ